MALTEAEWSKIDRAAWEAILGWPIHAGFDPQIGGLDFAELGRWFLWDKVARAVRSRVDPAAFAAEARTLGWPSLERARMEVHGPGRMSRLVQDATAALRGAMDAVTIPAPRSKGGSVRTLFLPAPSSRLVGASASLAAVDLIDLVAPDSKTVFPHARRVPYPRGLRPPDEHLASELCSAMLAGLRSQDVHLFAIDAASLAEQIVALFRQVEAARGYLESVKPDALLVHADNHPPHQAYVLLARTLGIPSIVLQHGLDCERFYLDEAYADVIAVWGPERAERYRGGSSRQPKRLEVTGNPEFDALRVPQSLQESGGYWLWVTRPHSSAKCYSPSRSPAEGVAILHALLDALATFPDQRLVIKPHPYDDAGVYADLVRTHASGCRVAILDTPVPDLLPSSGIVISEDTTAGMEAMFLGKRVVHAHFAASPPTVGYVAYRAALPGFDPDELAKSLRLASHLRGAEAVAMLDGQRAFLFDHAGPCDGNAASRVRNLILREMGLD